MFLIIVEMDVLINKLIVLHILQLIIVKKTLLELYVIGMDLIVQIEVVQ